MSVHVARFATTHRYCPESGAGWTHRLDRESIAIDPTLASPGDSGIGILSNAGRARSLGLDVCEPDHLRPLRNLALDGGREFRRCATDQVETNIEEAFARLGHRHHAQALPVNLV